MAVRDIYPEKEMTLIFQPHLFSRTRDFMNEFAEALSLADRLLLMEIYPAREKPIEGITSSVLLEKSHANISRYAARKNSWIQLKR
jgi:UDP-N-acetylmuramate--alanine ligase